jgi:myo-inositol 2-dehydrogenase/D-chiro-inositol 1-dehydrogenase
VIKLVVVGAGSHSQGNHLPALARYAAQHPGEVELGALCDLRRAHAEAMAAQYGLARVYVDVDEMLRAERPDGCIAVTPIPVTAQVAAQVIRAGVPLLMEKPPGATLDEARGIVDLAEQSGARVMVSMNRRFDPALRAALDWWRVNRDEPEFIYGTAIHPVDAMREIAGDIADYTVNVRPVDGVSWFAVRLVFESGAIGTLEVLPTAGSMAESYEIFGPGIRALVRAGGPDSGEVRCWERGQLEIDDEPAKEMPDFVRNGAYGEIEEFVAALEQGRMPYPSPAQVLQSVQVCYQIQQQFSR